MSAGQKKIHEKEKEQKKANYFRYQAEYMQIDSVKKKL